MDLLVGGDTGQSAVVRNGLARLDGRDWIRLDDAARPWFTGSPLAPIQDWPALLADPDLPGAVAGSMHQDGRVRQLAVQVLNPMPGPVPAAALAVRTADPVLPVRTGAWQGISSRTEPVELAAIVSVLLLLLDRRRSRHQAYAYLAGLAGGAPDLLVVLSGTGDRSTRLWALAALERRRLLTRSGLTARAERDPDPMVALWCARHLVTDDRLPDGIAGRLFSSARAVVRAFAVTHAPAADLTPDRLQALLLDRSGAVRSVSQGRWTRLRGDPAPVYRAVLATSGTTARRRAAALQGLDDLTSVDALDHAVALIADPSPRVRLIVAGIIGRRGTGDDLTRYLHRLLQDEASKVVTAAVKYSRRAGTVPAGTLDRLDRDGTARSRRIALSLRQSQGSWNRVEADLRAIGGDDAELAGQAGTDLGNWLQHGAATAYGRPAPDQARRLATLLQAPAVTAGHRQAISGLAGLGSTGQVRKTAEARRDRRGVRP